MSITSDESYNDGSPRMGVLGYVIGFSAAIFAFLFLTILTAYFCSTRNAIFRLSNPETTTSADQDSSTSSAVDVEEGLDEETLSSYPKLLYSQAKLHYKPADDHSVASCSICLGDYMDSDMLRLLPDCRHVFHLNCVDSWLRLHPTCPICRNFPVPTPLATPLAEVVPSAMLRA